MAEQGCIKLVAPTGSRLYRGLAIRRFPLFESDDRFADSQSAIQPTARWRYATELDAALMAEALIRASLARAAQYNEAAQVSNLLYRRLPPAGRSRRSWRILNP
jgi:hypothetical protein